jgi:hypothetical protein
MTFCKNLVIGLLSLSAVISAALPSLARPATISYEANLRSGPSLYTSRIDGLPEGTPLEVMRIVADTNSETQSHWYYVRSTGRLKTEGWVTSSLVNFNASDRSYGTITGEAGDVINIRSAPNLNGKVLHTGVMGDVVMLGDSEIDNNGYRWHYVIYPNQAAGWVRADLISIDS